MGGYGRRELFPYSDVDLVYLLDGKVDEKDIKQPIRRMSQELWDSGIRLSPVTRRRSECEQFNPDNVEFALAMLDHRLLAGRLRRGMRERLVNVGLPKLLEKEHKGIRAGLLELTEARHAKYGNTLFHLEPSIKDCPGGLRDVHVCGWLKTLADAAAGGLKKGAVPNETDPIAASDHDEFQQAVEFLSVVRCFLHYRHDRDDNTLDWQAQDAVRRRVTLGWSDGIMTREWARQRERDKRPAAEAAYWMRLYFRHARSVERRLTQMLGETAAKRRVGILQSVAARARRGAEPPVVAGFRVVGGRVVLDRATSGAERSGAGSGSGAASVCGDVADRLRARPGERGANVAGAPSAVGASGGGADAMAASARDIARAACGRHAAGDACAGDT